MATRSAFLMRSLRVLPILLSTICFLAPASALPPSGGGHGGGGHGGGHSGGGHGGGHSSGRHTGGAHTGGHFGWRHFGFGKHSARHAGFDAPFTSDTPAHLASHLWNFATPAREPSIRRIPPTLLWSPPLISPRPNGRVPFTSSHVRTHHRAFFRTRFPCATSSGCFFNGITEVCFFEPLLSLLSFSGDFDLFYPGFGFGGDSPDLDDDSEERTQLEMSVIVPPTNLWGDDAAEGNSLVPPGATLGATTEDRDVGNGVFLLVLKNGTSHAVTDYWVADGYLEYVSPDGAHGHIPLEAVDLQNTVVRNTPRGLRFVLRSTPAQNR
jgi:hypothetical protein